MGHGTPLFYLEDILSNCEYLYRKASSFEQQEKKRSRDAALARWWSKIPVGPIHWLRFV